jgi:hypothetical protein
LIIDDQRLDKVEMKSVDKTVREYDLCYADEACSEIPAPPRQPPPGRGHGEGGRGSRLHREVPLPGARRRLVRRGTHEPLSFVEHYTGENERAGDTGIRLADVNADGYTECFEWRRPR